MFDELKKGMKDAFGTSEDELLMESLINDEVRFICMENDEALEEACKKACKEEVDSTGKPIKKTGAVQADQTDEEPKDDIDRLIDSIPEDEDDDDAVIESLIENLPEYEL